MIFLCFISTTNATSLLLKDDDDLSFEASTMPGPCRIFSPIGHASPPPLSRAKRAEKKPGDCWFYYRLAKAVQFFEITIEKVREA